MVAAPPPPLVSPEQLLCAAAAGAVLVGFLRPRRLPGSLPDLAACAAWVTPPALLAAAAVGALDPRDLETALPWDTGLVPRYASAGLAVLLAGAVALWALRARLALRAAERASVVVTAGRLPA